MPRSRPRPVWVLAIALLGSAAAAPASAVDPRIETWVVEGDSVPGGDERLLFLEEPAMGREEVAFFGATDRGLGVFLAGRNGITEWVGNRWWSARGGLSYDGDWLAITAFSPTGGPHSHLAVYRFAGGALSEIIAAGDPMPGHPGLVISGLGNPSTDDGQVAFIASGADPAGFPGIPPLAILRYTEPAGVEVAVDAETPVPGDPAGRFGFFRDLQVADGALAFFAGYHTGSGYFLERQGEIRRVAALGDPVPGGLPGEVFERFPDHAELTTSDGTVAFLAEGSEGTAGIYWNAAGVLEPAVDTRTPVPGGSAGETFRYFGQAALSGGDLVFEGGRPGRTAFDLFLLRDGVVTAVADGQEGSGLFLTPAAFRDGRVAFLDHGEEPGRLRVAHLDGGAPPPEGESYLSELYPDFRFTVRITAGGRVIPTHREPECLADALCVGGALPGRAEIALRILGPRPNGYLWPVVGRLSPSRIEVWIEQISTGLLRYYLLDALPRESETLEGLVDRQGFPVSP